MEQHANFITVATRDLDVARAFYCTGLGWQPLMDVPGEIIFFQIAPGLVLGLFAAEKFAADLGGADTGTAVAGVTIAHNVSDRDSVVDVVAQMTSAGAEILVAPEDGAFGGIFHAIVRDPNGIIWEVAHNPGWRVLDDGTVVFA